MSAPQYPGRQQILYDEQGNPLFVSANLQQKGNNPTGMIPASPSNTITKVAWSDRQFQKFA